MKAFDRIIVVTLLVLAVIFASVNIAIASAGDVVGRPYRVEAGRAEAEIRAGGLDSVDLSDYPALLAIIPIDGSDPAALEGGQSDYLIKEINGVLYRFDYRADSSGRERFTAAVNLALGAVSALVLLMLLYVRAKIIRPFCLLRDMPYELSRGNLTVPLKENRHRYFGKFLWGMDMLRESLEQQKQTELSLHSERKKLILALSHDIRIPLSAIRLYSKALTRGLYDSPEKQHEIAEKIDEKAGEIEGYVSRIVTASREDFLSLEVNDGEFYLSDMMDAVKEYYAEKLTLTKTAFTVGSFINCLLRGDRDRSVEVLQNIMENAIKYGDGESIEITFSTEENCRLVTVANTGCTLPPEELPHIFDSFWRGSNAGQSSGSGLGLYICRSLMRKMGGEVFADIRDGRMLVTAVFPAA